MQLKIFNNSLIRFYKSEDAKSDIFIIHGFGESGLSFANALESEVAKQNNIWITDLPGFGASPYQNKFISIEDYISHLIALIKATATTQNIFLVGHSFGGVIATILCERLEKAKGFISIEGNLTQADSYFSGWAGQYDDGIKFQQDFKKLLFDKAKTRPEFEHYFASATIANSNAFIVLGKASRILTKNEDAGKRYINLNIPKLYLWGEVDTPLITQQFIENNKILHHCFKNKTHWMMKEEADLFYNIVNEFIKTNL
jgi:pimeloyl-ACP methyl ester carboxylesterase